MPVDVTAFLLFAGAAFTICITPGPDMLYVFAHGLHQGARAGVVSAFGMAAGMIVHTALAALGLAALFESFPVAYGVVRFAGAAYLIYIGIRTLREPPFTAAVGEREWASMRAVFSRAVVTNLLNPKIVLFYVAFLPQFIDPETGSAIAQFLLLGFTFVVLGLVVDSIIGVLSGTLHMRMIQNATLSRVLNVFSGVILCALGLRLVVWG